VENICGECKGQKGCKNEESNRKNDNGHKKEFGDTKKGREKRRRIIMVGRIKYGKGSLRIIGIYVNGDVEKKLEELREWMKGEGVKTIIGGDFKARTGREEG